MKLHADIRVVSTTLALSLLLLGVPVSRVGAIPPTRPPVVLDDPLTYDAETVLAPSDAGASDQLGTSVAIDGDTAVIGAPSANGGAGSVRVFERTEGVWVQTAVLADASPNAWEFFGRSVAVEGNTIVVGAHRDQEGGVNKGAVQVFTRDGSTWAHAATITPSVRVTNGEFGFDVAISGDTIAVGSYGYSAQQGAAYVFRGSGSTWVQEQLIPAQTPGSYQFGWSVDVDANTLLVGCPEDDAAGFNSGAAYAYLRTGVTWTYQGQLLGLDTETNDLLGGSVALDGDTAILGARAADEPENWSGAAYVFHRNGATWAQAKKLLPSDGDAQDEFGCSVALDGAVVIVGAEKTAELGATTGSAYIFASDGADWVEIKSLAAGDAAAGANYGAAVAIDGNAAVVGAYDADGAALQSGEAYIYNSAYAVSEDETLTVAAPGFLGNDWDPLGLTFAAYTTSGPSHGQLWPDNDGGFVYKPEPNFHGYDSFRYKAANMYAESDWATVSLWVEPAYDAISIAGTDRFDTSAKAAMDFWGANGGTESAIIATGRNFPDALGGSALAGYYAGPVLLVDTNIVPESVADALVALGVSNVTILGGTSAVSDAVKAQLFTIMGAGSTVGRISGADRYDTARKVAGQLITDQGTNFDGTAFVATGKAFPDALAAGPIAAAQYWPIYLVNNTGADATTIASMKAAGVTDVQVLGGVNAVSAATYTSLTGAFGAGHVERQEGPNRYATAAKVASMGVSQAGLKWDGLGFATGTTFPDALSAGADLGPLGTVLLLTSSDSLSPEAEVVLSANRAVVDDVRFFGGTSALSTTVRNRVSQVIQGP